MKNALKIKRRLFLVIISGLIFCGCATTPDNTPMTSSDITKEKPVATAQTKVLFEYIDHINRKKYEG